MKKLINLLKFLFLFLLLSSENCFSAENNTKLSLWPQRKASIIGDVIFNNPIEKGAFGDRITALRLTGMNYIKLPSKYDSSHGIDGVYKSKNPNKEEILIVENKVDTAKLNEKTNQMSDAWVLDRTRRLVSNGDQESKATGESIINAFNKNPSFVKKQLWTHNIEKGSTTVYELGENAETINQTYTWTDKLIGNELIRMCNSKKLECFLN